MPIFYGQAAKDSEFFFAINNNTFYQFCQKNKSKSFEKGVKMISRNSLFVFQEAILYTFFVLFTRLQESEKVDKFLFLI